MEKKFIQGRLIEKADGSMEFIVSDETVDRHGESVSLDTWDLKNFLKAPRMLVDHDHRVEKIVGKWQNVHIDRSNEDGKGLKMTAVFHKITELSKETFEMVKKKFLDTVSVGYIPHIDSIGDGEDRKDVERNELIEVSLVTVPANPNATMVKSLIEATEEVDTTKIKEFVGEKEESQKEEKADEVIQIKDKPVEVKKDTPTAKGKSEKGRSLSKSQRQVIILRRGLRQAAEAINFALNRIKQK